MKVMKVLLIGDSGVGKSSLLLRFTCDRFDEDIASTIGIDFKVKFVQVSTNEQVQMQLWDTAGQERFRTLTASFYRGAHAVALVYDVSNEKSFEGLQRWLDEVRAFCPENVKLLVVANKVDLCENFSREAVVQFAKTNNALLALCSAKTRLGVVEAFEELARKVADSDLQPVRSTSLEPSPIHHRRQCC